MRCVVTRLGSLAPMCVATVTMACQSAAPAPLKASERPRAEALDWRGNRDDGTTAAASAQPDGGHGTWVLHVGDSFVHASFQQNIGPRVRATGSNYVVDAKTATYTTTWANDAEFDGWLAKRPSLVIVTLGANEVEMPDPAEHAPAVERIARKIAASGAACVWVTPPMWKRDTGILDVIHDHSAPCLFFDSDAVMGGLSPDERQRDHIHPNSHGGARWAEAFWGWLEAHRDAKSPGWALEPYELRGS